MQTCCIVVVVSHSQCFVFEGDNHIRTMKLFINVMVLALCGVVLVTSIVVVDAVSPPPYKDLAKRARYIVHKADWCTLTTMSSQSITLGLAFSEPTSISDGPVDKGTGIPYFFHVNSSFIVEDIRQNSKVTLGFSEAEFGLPACIPTADTDAEYPLCARLTIFGNMEILSDSTEIAVAKAALFPRHPAMASWQKEHVFVFLKLNINKLLILDYFGGWNPISTEDYFNVK